MRQWVAALLLVFAPIVQASTRRDQPGLTKDLAQTIASVFSITIQDYFVASKWNRPGTANVVEFRSLLPFKAWGQENLLRISVPFRTESELGPGLSDVRLFDLLMFDTGGGVWGVGPVFNLGINRGPEVDTLQVGPAATFVATSIPRMSVGVLNQNFFSSQISLSTLQPIFVYQLSPHWTIGLGELPIVYDWNEGQFAVFSMGVQLSYLVRAKQPIRFFVNPQFNTKSDSRLYHWTIASGVTLPIVPVGRGDSRNDR